MADYAYIPYIANPQTGVRPVGWLQSNYYSYEAWFSTQTDRVVKCAYRRYRNGTYSTLMLLCAGALGQAGGIQLRNNHNYSETVGWTIDFPSATNPDIYIANYLSYADTPPESANPDIPVYDTIEEIIEAFDDGNWELPGETFPIIYRPTNCTFPNAPAEAAVGDTVVVPVEFPDGYGLANTGDIYVQCNGVVIPSTYENGQLTFTMPDPS